MSAQGIYVQPTGIVDPLHAFKGCTFQDGIAAGTMLTINNNQTLTVRNAVFPTNTWGGASNVSKTLNQGQVCFVDYSGGFSGESFDNEAFIRVTWVPTLTATATASPGTICAASPAQLIVTRSGGIAPYTYLWSPLTGLSDPNIINPVATPASTTTYYVTATDALGTTATSSVVVNATPILPVSVTINASANPSPPGNYATFTASPVNGGSSPVYQWRVNGVNAGTGLPTYSYIPSNSEDVTCILTSNYACPSGNPATSNTIEMIVVNTNNTVTGTVPSPLSLCFDATNTVTVAGGGSTFVVQSGASAIMIAGLKILYLPGTTVQSGGYMHGYITTSNAYCGSLAPSMVNVIASEEENLPLPNVSIFSLYPNPTSGKFTIAQETADPFRAVTIEIFSMKGERLYMSTIYNEDRKEFDLTHLTNGLYLVKVMKDQYLQSFKLIINR